MGARSVGSVAILSSRSSAFAAAGGVVAGLLQIGDRLQRQAAGRIDLRDDPLVASDRGLDVTHRVGDELGLAQRDARLLGRRLRGSLESLQELGRLGVVAALDRVVDQVLGRLLVVAVLEDLAPRLPGGVLVAELVGVEIGGLAAKRRCASPCRPWCRRA